MQYKEELEVCWSEQFVVVMDLETSYVKIFNTFEDAEDYRDNNFIDGKIVELPLY